MNSALDLPNTKFNDTRVQWVNEPNGRGTISILITCLSTLLLCSWSAMHLNIPSKGTSKITKLRLSAYWCLIGIFGPELVIWVAWRQFASAKSLRDAMKRDPKRDPKWTLTQGYYALMGGFVFDFEESFPLTDTAFANGVQRLALTPKGVKLLFECGHLPQISEAEIDDKSKTDEIGKSLACIQATWMVVQVCTRLVLKLPITLLEVDAVSHVWCAVVFYGLWWYKPHKIGEPTILKGDWTRPLAAFMMMSSKVGKRQMLPGYRVNEENSEIAGLEFYTESVGRIVSACPSGNNEQFRARFRVREKPGRRSDHTDGSGIEEDAQCSERTRVRWELACAAIHTYDAVRALLRRPAAEEDKKFLAALAEYPEMPKRCHRKIQGRDVELGSMWWECNSQDFVVNTASNWPHDGLLRTTGGLLVGATLWLASIIFCSVYIAAWNADFPTNIEAWLWRSSTLYIAFSGLFWAVMHVIAEKSATVWWIWYEYMSGGASPPMRRSVTTLCLICGILYLFARTFLTIEALMSLRSLPLAAYASPQWTLAVPHVG